MSKLTPMMQQYKTIKKQYKDSILFFRLGDFYEMFYDDAIIASKILEIALTSRDADNKIPMAGIPHHSASNYINKLINKGYKVAICEQVEDPKDAVGIVKREVIRVITPGTIIDDKALEESKNNFLMSLYFEEKQNNYMVGLAFIDVSTGEFATSQFTSDKKYIKILDEVSKIEPAECIVPERLLRDEKFIETLMKNFKKLTINSVKDLAFTRKNASQKIYGQFNKKAVSFDLDQLPFAVKAVGGILEYLQKTQKTSLNNIKNIRVIQPLEFMTIDSNTNRNLELLKTLKDGTKSGSLIWVLDHTLTAMGGRLLRSWIVQPLLVKEKINERLFAVENLLKDTLMRKNIRNYLKEVYDLERIMSKITYGTANARDLIALKNSLSILPFIKESLSPCQCILLLKQKNNLDTLQDVFGLIDKSINNNPPMTLKEGNIIKKGYNEELDELRMISKEGKNLIASLEKKEKEKTGIRSLKIGFNKVFGYYIDVTKSNLSLVPDRYIRKQTLVNSERYITAELKELEAKILGAEEKIEVIEYNLFTSIRDTITMHIERIQKTAKIIAVLDVLTSFAEISGLNNYTKPQIIDNGEIEIKNGRHPVVELVLQDEFFVPNDIYLDQNENQMLIITGPNMAGKSTYMRQVALIVLMAQIGCFVPADNARISIVDRIFTRIGATDDLAAGDSTFMVEMKEVALILREATNKSLIVLDEVGRGTSTYDGMSIAWAVVEYIHEHIRAKTLFATHYHELTNLENKLLKVKNYSIAVKEKGDDVVFLRKVVKGGADKSYGVHVAHLAGLPQKVINNAQKIIKDLEGNEEIQKSNPSNGLHVKNSKHCIKVENKQLKIANYAHEQILEEINALDILTITPIEALNFLYEIKKKVNNIEG